MRFFNRALSKPIESSSRGGGADVAIQDSVDCFSAKALRNDENEGFRKSSIVLGRQIAIYFMRKHMHISLNEIGRHFGQRDHSTILHSYRKIEAISGEIENLNHRVVGSLASKAL